MINLDSLLYVNIPTDNSLSSKLLHDTVDLIYDKSSLLSDFKSMVNNKDFDIKKNGDVVLFVCSITDSHEFIKYMLSNKNKDSLLDTNRALSIASYRNNFNSVKEILSNSNLSQDNVKPLLAATMSSDKKIINYLISLYQPSLKDKVLDCFLWSLSNNTSLEVSQIFLPYIDLEIAKEKILTSTKIYPHARDWFLEMYKTFDTKNLMSSSLKSNQGIKPRKM